jgi:hypothetical protein
MGPNTPLREISVDVTWEKNYYKGNEKKRKFERKMVEEKI